MPPNILIILKETRKIDGPIYLQLKEKIFVCWSYIAFVSLVTIPNYVVKIGCHNQMHVLRIFVLKFIVF